MTILSASSSGYTFFGSSSAIGNKTKKINSGSAGGTFQFTSVGIGDTIVLPHAIVEATGNVLESMTSSIISRDENTKVFDELDLEIALMSDQEVLNAVLASAGAWADRDDLDELLDRSDRIDELYASNTDTSV